MFTAEIILEHSWRVRICLAHLVVLAHNSVLACLIVFFSFEQFILATIMHDHAYWVNVN